MFQEIPPPELTPPKEMPKVTYADVGGIESVLQDIRELIEWPLCIPEVAFFVFFFLALILQSQLHGVAYC